MKTIKELTTKTISTATNREAPPSERTIKAARVHSRQLDYVIDFNRFEPDYGFPVDENSLLEVNDIVVGFTGADATSVAIYSPSLRSPEPVTVANNTIAFRPVNREAAVSILAAILYAFDRKVSLRLFEVKALPIPPLTSEQVGKFLELVEIIHSIRVKARLQEKLLRELVPATVYHFNNPPPGGKVITEPDSDLLQSETAAAPDYFDPDWKSC